MNAFATLINAACEFIAAAMERVEQNAFGNYTPEDRASVQREAAAIETEIRQLAQLLDAVQAIARMRAPGIAQILRRRGFAYEAEHLDRLVRLADEITKSQENDADCAWLPD